jgi:hypothetical protein
MNVAETAWVSALASFGAVIQKRDPFRSGATVEKARKRISKASAFPNRSLGTRKKPPLQRSGDLMGVLSLTGDTGFERTKIASPAL